MSPVFCSVDEFVATQFDYLIVGGGTAGLCVAGRLSENENVTVGVLEAGSNRMDDKLVTTPMMAAKMIGNPKYDWCLETVPQPHAGNKAYEYPRGKMIGGCSAINFSQYQRGSKTDFDNWAKLGFEGWGWDDMLPYFKKTQHFEPPKVNTKHLRFADVQTHHGNDGPIHTSFSETRLPLDDAMIESCQKFVDQPTSEDPWNGDHFGFYPTLMLVDRTGERPKRSYAAAYLAPHLHRSNLKVLADATVAKIVVESLRATGAEFWYSDTLYTATASKEVILSSGTVYTPLLLEQSGIGDPEILARAGIECILENEWVGANLQDHMITTLCYDLNPEEVSVDRLRNQTLMEEQERLYEEGKTSVLSDPPFSFSGHTSLLSIAGKEETDRIIDIARRHVKGETQLDKGRDEIVLQELQGIRSSDLQFVFLAGHAHYSAPGNLKSMSSLLGADVSRAIFAVAGQHALSRGSVHVTSNDIRKPPRLDPNWYTNPADVELLATGVRFLLKVIADLQASGRVKERAFPNAELDLTNHEVLLDFVRNNSQTQWHPTSTASMGEVVDSKLRVKGISGLRIVDGSVMPTHVSGNMTSTVYAIAEKAADLIKQSWDQSIVGLVKQA